MFTGIIQSVGTVVSRQNKQGDVRFIIQTGFSDMSDVQMGDSIACNGVCLTVTAIHKDEISVDVSLETLNKTTLNQWQVSSLVNLEKSLTLKDKLGGHMVSGHVDAIATCTNIRSSARSQVYEFKIAKHLDKYIVKKGSIALDGVSLTVNEIKDGLLLVNLIPHTLQHSNLGQLQQGDCVNIEIDTIARYVEKMCQSSMTQNPNEK